VREHAIVGEIARDVGAARTASTWSAVRLPY